ncbi:MAG: glycosyltransferase family 2 protein [Lachnospiraceae bacterium]|nr:glycosyltransferase family 2 protein [Lachnospiraceae bacterium]
MQQAQRQTKYITFTIPCYNSQDYMKRCIESLLPGGEDVEIIIINDGSTDATAQIADDYEKRYPGIVRAVHKPNGGHGSGVNKGLELAQGIYFKVVDSDDWFDESAYAKLLGRIKRFCNMKATGLTGEMPDLFVFNYLYDHLDEGTSHMMHYRNVFPLEEMCDWNDIGRFRTSQYLIMHALMFRTDVLRRAGVILPEHTFYVDNIFAYKPLPYVRHIYYMDIDLYHYYIGREDQSVNEKVLMSRIDQQIKVTEIVSKCVDLNEVKEVYPKLAEYMCRNISIMMAISSIHLLLINSQEAYGKRKRLWDQVKEDNARLYFRLKYTTLSGLTYLPGKLGGMLTRSGYRAARKIYQFQ